MGLGRPWALPLAMEHPPPTSYQDILRCTWASSDRAGLNLGEGTVLPASTPLLSSYRGLGGFPKLGGTFFRDPNNKDHNMLGSRLGFPFLGNSQQKHVSKLLVSHVAKMRFSSLSSRIVDVYPLRAPRRIPETQGTHAYLQAILQPSNPSCSTNAKALKFLNLEILNPKPCAFPRPLHNPKPL